MPVVHARRAEDARLVTASRAGDPTAFPALFAYWFDPCVDVAWRILRDREAAADVAQDVFLGAWRALDRLRDPGAFGGWALRASRNQALNRLARERRSTPAGDDAVTSALDADPPTDETAAVVGREDDARLVWAASAALGERDASLLDLHLRHGLAVPEIAEALGVTANNAHQLLFRLRKRLSGAIRAWVLWRDGAPACPILGGALVAAGVTRFGADAVRITSRHLPDCEDCDARQQLRLAPEALFAAMPILPAAPALRAKAAAALEAHGVPVTTPPSPPPAAPGSAAPHHPTTPDAPGPSSGGDGSQASHTSAEGGPASSGPGEAAEASGGSGEAPDGPADAGGAGGSGDGWSGPDGAGGPAGDESAVASAGGTVPSEGVSQSETGGSGRPTTRRVTRPRVLALVGIVVLMLVAGGYVALGAGDGDTLGTGPDDRAAASPSDSPASRSPTRSGTPGGSAPGEDDVDSTTAGAPTTAPPDGSGTDDAAATDAEPAATATTADGEVTGPEPPPVTPEPVDPAPSGEEPDPDQPPVDPPDEEPGLAPEVVSFVATRLSAGCGALERPVVLAWESANATGATLTGPGAPSGALSPSGSTTLCLTGRAQPYTLTVTGPGGSASATASA